VARLGRGDVTRGSTGVSMLAARLCDCVGSGGGRLFGMAGTGGASSKLGRADPRFGDGSRNVRSVIEPELPLRSSWAPGCPRTDPVAELPIEEFELALRIVLFVWTSATDVGVVGRARNAAAAAAADKEALDAWGLRKANAAAACAEAFTLGPLPKDCKSKVSIFLEVRQRCALDSGNIEAMGAVLGSTRVLEIRTYRIGGNPSLPTKHGGEIRREA
jgi:hypothetical protein